MSMLANYAAFIIFFLGRKEIFVALHTSSEFLIVHLKKKKTREMSHLFCFSSVFLAMIDCGDDLKLELKVFVQVGL